MKIEIAYALPEFQYIETIEVSEDCTIQMALEQIEFLHQKFPDLNLNTVEGVGVFGKKMPLNAQLKEGDRIELYRPLMVDPKEARRNRAKISSTSE